MAGALDAKVRRALSSRRASRPGALQRPISPSASNTFCLVSTTCYSCLGLMLLTASLRDLVKAITAFTLAHSITLAAATLGFVHMPPAPIEAAIALSIVFVAVEIVHARQGQIGIAARMPWLIAFAFGLVARLRIRRRAERSGIARKSHPIRASVLQHRCRSRTIALRGRRSRPDFPITNRYGAGGPGGHAWCRLMPSASWRCFGFSSGSPRSEFYGRRSKMRTHLKVMATSMLALGLAVPALAEDPVVTDIGTFDKGTAERVFPAKRAYSPYAGRNFPTRPLLRRHPSPHDVLFRCRRFRRAPVAERRLSFCQRRGDHRLIGTTGKAVTAVGFPGRSRSLRQYGLLSVNAGRKTRRVGGSHGEKMV